MKKSKIIITGLLFFLLLLSVFIVSQRRYLHRHNIDIDLNSGLCRDRYYFWFIPITTKTFETDYSKLVQPYAIKEDSIWYNDIEVGSLFSYYSSGGEWSAVCHEFAMYLCAGKYDESQTKELIQKSMYCLKNKDLKGLKELTNQISGNIELEK